MTETERNLLMELSKAVAGLLHERESIRLRHPAATEHVSGADACERLLKLTTEVICQR